MSDFDKSEYWFESAEYDLQTARAMLETRRLLYVGFMCHQTIEKALKGIFVSRKPEEELPYIHKLMRLANLSEISSEMSEEQLWETTMNPETRLLKQVTIEDAAGADYVFSMLMGEDVGPRREFIEQNATFANIDA